MTKEDTDKVRAAILELRQMHSYYQPDCKDEGSSTCPTWGTIHGLESLLEKKPE